MWKKLLTVGITAVLLLTFSYELLWGKLFPYSPVKLGFTKYELSNVVVYVQDGSTFQYQMIDSLIPPVEKFHNLHFTHKPEVMVFHDAETYLQRSTTKARFCAYPNGSLVVSPWAVQEAHNGTISMDIYLRHELSHALLYDHMGLLVAYSFYPQWLLEGIAVYSTNQMGTTWYPSKTETYAYIRQGNFLPPDYFKTSRENEVRLDVTHRVTFMYSEFACIVDYLIERHGKEKFMRYMTQLTDSYQHDKTFKEVYGIDFETCLHDFKKHTNDYKTQSITSPVIH